MLYEPVLTIWNYHDGPLSGTAEMNGVPHFFETIFDDGIDDYSDRCELYPIGPEFTRRYLRLHEIFEAWAKKFNAGLVDQNSHPAASRADEEYNALRAWLENKAEGFELPPKICRAIFRLVPGQDDSLRSMQRKFEVAWLAMTD